MRADVYDPTLDRDGVLAVLRANMPMLRERYGVTRLQLFGSFARDEAGPRSDINVAAEFEDGRGLFDVGGAWQTVAELFDRDVYLTRLKFHSDAFRRELESDLVDV